MALYTLAEVRDQAVVCFAHVTNQMGLAEEDFEKRKADRSVVSLEVIDAAVAAWRE